jgi:hypothetical protein
MRPIARRKNMTALIRDGFVEGKAETLFPLDTTTSFGRLRIEDDKSRFPIFFLSHTHVAMHTTLSIIRAVLVILTCSIPTPLLADNVVELPVLAAIDRNNLGVFEVLLIWWDKKPQPEPAELQWIVGKVRLGNTHLGSMAQAFSYAIERTPSVHHSGTVSVAGVAYAPSGTDGPSAGAAMAVGFIAMFKGEKVQRGIALTGSFEPGGKIGFVGRIPDKIRAAAREGYHTILVPRGQVYNERWNLNELALQLNVTVKEVETVDEAYQLMTGQPI